LPDRIVNDLTPQGLRFYFGTPRDFITRWYYLALRASWV